MGARFRGQDTGTLPEFIWPRKTQKIAKIDDTFAGWGRHPGFFYGIYRINGMGKLFRWGMRRGSGFRFGIQGIFLATNLLRHPTPSRALAPRDYEGLEGYEGQEMHKKSQKLTTHLRGGDDTQCFFLPVLARGYGLTRQDITSTGGQARINWMGDSRYREDRS